MNLNLREMIREKNKECVLSLRVIKINVTQFKIGNYATKILDSLKNVT